MHESLLLEQKYLRYNMEVIVNAKLLKSIRFMYFRIFFHICSINYCTLNKDLKIVVMQLFHISHVLICLKIKEKHEYRIIISIIFNRVIFITTVKILDIVQNI